MITSLVKRVLERAGYDIVAPWRRNNWSRSQRLRELFDRFDIDCVIDVGANRGQYRDFLRLEMGFKGRIVSFEPLAGLASKLAERANTDPLWTVHACALGREAAEIQMNVMKWSPFSSIHAPKLDAPFSDQNTVVATQPVSVRRLDSFDIDGNLYFKLDTQGYDVEAFSGATALLPHVRAMQSEVSLIPIYEGAPGWEEALAVYRSSGFAISDFFTVSYDGDERAVEFDCVLVRDPAASAK